MDPTGVEATRPSQRTSPSSSPVDGVVELGHARSSRAGGRRRRSPRAAARRSTHGQRGQARARRSRRRRTRSNPLVELVVVDGGEEADLAEVDGEDGHAGARRSARSAAQDRAVAAEHDGRSLSLVGSSLDPAPSRLPSPCFSASSGGNRTSIPAVRRPARSGRPQRVRRSPAVGRAERRDRRAAGALTARPRAPRRGRSTRPGRAASAIQTKLSRLPAGPGRPEEAKPSTDVAERAGEALAGGRERGAPVGGVADHAALADAPPPDLELRLDESQAVEPLGGAPPSTAGSTLASEMKETSTTTRSGR